MIENDYPIPSYMADVFEKPTGWAETPQPVSKENKWRQKIYAIDCEMVRFFLSPDVLFLTFDLREVSDGGRERIDEGVCY